jgi:hypothetical protein
MSRVSCGPKARNAGVVRARTSAPFFQRRDHLTSCPSVICVGWTTSFLGPSCDRQKKPSAYFSHCAE